MAKSNGQKMKILLIMKELLEKTDEENVLSMAELIQMLKQNGISAERKSIYDDVNTLRAFGIDIVLEQKKGYYIASRDFELAELKLLVDAVQCAKFITRSKSEELIKKLEKLTSKYEAAQLHRQVFVLNRVKTENVQIYYNVDKIHTAISRKSKVSFQYYEWTMEKEMRPRRNGKVYEISPWALTWDDENYYMIGYDKEAGKIKHYRVDKMKNLEILRGGRDGREVFDRFDIASYAKKMFGMFGGKEEEIRLVCKNEMIGVIIDRFGKNVQIYPKKDGVFVAIIKVSVSPQFFGWLFGLGDGVRIDSPREVAEQFQIQLDRLAKNYRKRINVLD